MTCDTVTLFTASRRSHCFGLLVAGALFAVIGLGGSGAIVRNFVTAGTYAAVAAVTTRTAG
jgi:D-arabinose 1-dehydrogenase-like Zn-dependent alcohol dehydrogenase